MAKLNNAIAVPLGIALVALAVALPIAITFQESGKLPEPCSSTDSTCADFANTIAAEDGEAGLSLLQRTAAVVTKTMSQTKTETAHQQTTASTGKAKVGSKNGAKMAPVFFDVTTMDYWQLSLVTLIYGYVLYVGSNMIGDGSELLCFFKSVAGIVGSVVVPILGAVPDSAMVLFSGLGPDAQVQVTTGVGALAGSTVMLLTFPWFIVCMAGSVPLAADGTADYKKNKEPAYLFTSGVTFGDSVKDNTKIMVITSLSFLIIQIPAFFMDRAGVAVAVQAKAEASAAMAGLVVTIIFFFGYCGLMYWQSAQEGNVAAEKRLEVFIAAIKNKQVNLSTTLFHLGEHDNDEVTTRNLSKILREFFFQYDTDKSKSLECKEFESLLRDLGEQVEPAEAKRKFDQALAADSKKGKDGLSFDGFITWAKAYKQNYTMKTAAKTVSMPSYEESDDEEDVVPEDLANQPPEVQARSIAFRSCSLMGLGTALVLLFADPAVNVFTEWGDRFGISSFYVGFVLAPFASNASELLVALGYARAKTGKKITMSFESLVGAACMNNTLCLAVFFALVYFKKLAWMFKAETAGILIIQWIMAVLIMSSNTQKKYMGYVILSMYPLCLLIVWFLENVVGWD